MAKNWVNKIKNKINIFSRNVFSIRNKKTGKSQKVEVMRLNSHKFFKQRFSVYLNSKKKVLQSFKLNNKQIQKAIELSSFSMVGLKAYQSQVVSFNAALKIRTFLKNNRNFLINVLSKNGGKLKPDPKISKFVDLLEKSLDSSIKREQAPKGEFDYNPGIVERVDHILLPKNKHNSKPIVLDRILLMTLAELESDYVRSIVGKNFEKFVEKDNFVAKQAFGDGGELII